MHIITCEHLTLQYEQQLTAIEDLHFHVEEKDCLCIVGENGAGKSTLIKVLLGLLKPPSGQVRFAEGVTARDIGYLPQLTQAQRDFPASVGEIVLSGCLNALGRRAFYGAKERARVQEALEDLGIADLRSRCYRELSGGQQQRVLLARALCAARKVLLLDEPGSGLDPIATQEMYSLIKHINEDHGIAIIMVTHDLRNSLRFAKHILQLEQKQLFFGTPAEYRVSRVGRHFLAHEKFRLSPLPEEFRVPMPEAAGVQAAPSAQTEPSEQTKQPAQTETSAQPEPPTQDAAPGKGGDA